MISTLVPWMSSHTMPSAFIQKKRTNIPNLSRVGIVFPNSSYTNFKLVDLFATAYKEEISAR
jgi:hypothetical protein